MIKLILIAYKFPPYTGVGARRWKKFTEQLCQKNIEITVITQQWYSHEPYHTNDKNIKIMRIIDPFYWLKQNIKFLSGFITKLEFLNRRLFNHTDEGYHFNKKAFKKASSLIENENINLLIATSPPYSSNYFAGLLKNKFPHLKVIQDVRDAWIDGYFSWNEGTADSHPTYKKEVEMEKLALNNCDAVVAVTPGLLERLKLKIKNKAIRVELITNGYDTADSENNKDRKFPPELDAGKLNICHFGTLDFGREDEFIIFLKALHSNSVLSESVNVVLIGNNNPKIENYISVNSIKNLKLLPIQAVEKLYSLMFFSDFHLLVNDKEFYYAYGSKIFDAFLYKKPVILVSKKESFTQLVDRLKIGLTTDNSSEGNRKVIERLLDVYMNKEKISTLFSYDKVDLQEFEIANLSQKYYKLIKDLTD